MMLYSSIQLCVTSCKFVTHLELELRIAWDVLNWNEKKNIFLNHISWFQKVDTFYADINWYKMYMVKK